MADQERALTRIDIVPLVPTEVARNRLAEIRAFVKEELREGLDGDYAVIPGTGKKPSLLQPGAEKLCEKLGLSITYPQKEWVYEDWDRGEFGVDVLCRLINPLNERVYGECWGSAARSAQEEVDAVNAREREYAERDGKPIPTTKPLRFSHKGLARNTAVKMAQKSALVGATLKAARLAVDFTQDVEDFSAAGAKPAAQADVSSPYYCQVHKTEWFKRGKMHNYAHPVGDGTWCNMPEPGELLPTKENAPGDVEKAPPQRTIPRGTGTQSKRPETKELSLSDFWAGARELGYDTGTPEANAAIWSVLGVVDMTGIKAMGYGLALEKLRHAERASQGGSQPAQAVGP